MSKFNLFLFIFYCALLCQVPQASAQSLPKFRLSPTITSQSSNKAYFVYEANVTGSIINDTVAILNKGTESITLALYAADGITASRGGVSVATQFGELPQKSGTWLTLAQDTVTIAPDEAANVPFTLQIPENTSAGEYAAMIVAQPAEMGESSGVQFVPRFAISVMTMVEGELESELVVEGISAESTNNGYELITTLHNRGNAGIPNT